MQQHIHVRTVGELLKFFKINDPLLHPLVAIVDFSKVKDHVSGQVSLSSDIYSVMFKYECTSFVRYGRRAIDFQNGSLICMGTGQTIEMEGEEEAGGNKGWGLFFHPDLVRSSPLNDKMKDYTFFSYQMSEALHLSEKERNILSDCVEKINNELSENIDIHSQSIIVSNIELLLNYCTRFYGRQFITRASSDNSVAVQVEKFLSDYFASSRIADEGLPSVKLLAEEVHLSPGYLGDLLKKETGKSTQDHIHFHLIEAAKNILLGTNKTIGEIAYSLGFEYPQYFNKLFKQKTGKTPVEFRNLN